MRKQTKPNIAIKRAKRPDGSVRVNYYFRKMVDGKEVYIPIKAKLDTPEFDRIYWAIRSGRHSEPKPRTTYKSLIESYMRSSAYLTKALSTRKKYRSYIKIIENKNADKDYRKTRRRDVMAIHAALADTPRVADGVLQTLRILFGHAIDLETVAINPASGIKLFGPQKEFKPWPQDKQDAFERYCVEHGHDVALMAFRLGTATGQRAGDLVKMKWSHFDGEYMAVIQEKTHERITIYCPEKLRKALSDFPKTGEYILSKGLRGHIGYDALEKRVRTVRSAINAKDFTMHGWRFTAALELAESGCSDAEIQAVTGHRTLEMVQKYRRRANQKRLSKMAQQRRERNINAT